MTLRLITTLAFGLSVSAHGLDLVKDGKPVATIVVPEPANHIVTPAANLLQTVWLEASGAKLEIVPESAATNATVIVSVGATRLAQQAGLGIEKLENEGFVVKVVGNTLFVVGRDLSTPVITYEGSIRAAMELLQSHFGVRFVAPSPKGLKVPKSPNLSVPDGFTLAPRTPSFQYAMGRFGAYHHAPHAHWSKVHRFDAFGVLSCGGHTWTQVFPDAMLATNLEFVAELRGKRTAPSGNNAMLCTSHPEFVPHVVKWMQARFDEGYGTVELGQSDGYAPCECARCNKLFGDVKTAEGKTNRCLMPHREAALKLAKSHPHKTVMITAYDITLMPHKSFPKMPDNVMIELAPPAPEAMAAWKGKAKRFSAYVYMWGEYQTSGLGPNGRSLDQIASTMREWHSMGVRGLYYCGGDYNWGILGPQYYLAAALQGDIAADEKELFKEYCETLYGNAAPAMQQFFESVYERAKLYVYFTETVPGREETPELVYTLTYPPEIVAAWQTILDRAKSQAGTDERALGWIRSSQIGLDYIRHLSNCFHAWRAWKMDRRAESLAVLERQLEARRKFNETIKALAQTEPQFVANYFPNYNRFLRYLEVNGTSRATLREPFTLDPARLRAEAKQP